MTEAIYGIQVDRYEFNTAEGGEGKFRGGRGLIRDYRILSDQGGFITSHLRPPQVHALGSRRRQERLAERRSDPVWRWARAGHRRQNGPLSAQERRRGAVDHRIRRRLGRPRRAGSGIVLADLRAELIESQRPATSTV